MIISALFATSGSERVWSVWKDSRGTLAGPETIVGDYRMLLAKLIGKAISFEPVIESLRELTLSSVVGAALATMPSFDLDEAVRIIEAAARRIDTSLMDRGRSQQIQQDFDPSHRAFVQAIKEIQAAKNTIPQYYTFPASLFLSHIW